MSGIYLADITRKPKGTRYFSYSRTYFCQSLFAILITTVSNGHISLRNMSECEYECVCGSTWLQNHNYLKSNTVWTSSQPSKSHINETSPNSKLKKFFPFEIIHMDSASFFVRRGHFIWNRWAGGFVTNQLQQFFGGCGAEENMYSGLDVPLYASLLLAWPFLNVAMRKMEGQPLQVRRKSKELSLMWTWGVLFWVNLCWEPSVTQALLQVLYEHCFT